MGLIELIQEFQSTISQVHSLVEEAKGMTEQILEVSGSEMPTQIAVTREQCEAGIKLFETAITQLEEIEAML